MKTNTNKRAQTQTNAAFRLSEMGPKKLLNAGKRRHAQTKLKSENVTPFYAPPFAAAQNTGRTFIFQEKLSAEPDKKVIFRELICASQDYQPFQDNLVWKFSDPWPSSTNRKIFSED